MMPLPDTTPPLRRFHAAVSPRFFSLIFAVTFFFLALSPRVAMRCARYYAAVDDAAAPMMLIRALIMRRRAMLRAFCCF